MKVDESSQLLKNLKDYDIGLDADLRRKVDYFITPYHNAHNIERHMTFYEPSDITSGLKETKVQELDKEKYKNVNLIERPVIQRETQPMRQSHELAHFHWSYLMKKLL